jgi:quercetin dioxygenase-like cupin family protein
MKQSSDSPKHAVKAINLIARGADMQVREFIVDPTQSVAWHKHSVLTDWCYCLEGRVSFELADEAQRSTCARILLPGESCMIPAGSIHRLRSADDRGCRYLLIQQGAHYDFLPQEFDWLPTGGTPS